MSVYGNRASKMRFFGVKDFFMTFDFKNECKNEFKDENAKSWSWSRNRVSHKIDFKAVRPRNDHAASVGVNGNELVYVDAFKFLGLGVLIGQLESLIVSSLPRPPVPVVTLGNQKWSKTAKITVGFRRQNLKRDIRSSPPSLVASSWPPESHYFGTSGQNLSKYPQMAVTDFRP